jgi:crotonobetainyl-CoA:carnitine CoA-transferase CaiB-like acyl-CoA transferase
MGSVVARVCAMNVVDPRPALERAWLALGGAADALTHIEVTGCDPVVRSSYAIGALAASAIGTATLAAAQTWTARTGERQAAHIAVENVTRALRSDQLLRIDGARPGPVWSPISGFYRTGDERFVQLHTNFPHHLQRTLGVLEVGPDRERVGDAIRRWDGAALEDALTAAGACASLARSRQEWLAHPQGDAVHALPLLDTVRLDDSPPRALPPAGRRPLAGVRVLDLTRVIAGPVATRTLAAHGAEVLRVSSRALPEIDAVLPDTSIGKRSTYLDLRSSEGTERFRRLLDGADVVVQSYRPGALDALGFGAPHVTEVRPGIVYVSLSAYSHEGPWRDHRGYDTLVQTASGVALSEAAAFESARPRHVPVSALDHATGYFAAAAAMLALVARHERGGGRHVRCSLAQTREWLEMLGRVEGTATPPPDDDAIVATLPTFESPFGRVSYAPPGGALDRTPAYWAHGPVAPGVDPPAWRNKW